MAKNESLQERIGYSVNERLINGLVALLGIVLILVGIFCSKPFGENVETILVSVGTSLIASSVVSYLTSIYIYKRKKEKEVTEQWGVYSISDNRGQMNINIADKLDRSKDHLDIIAYGLKSFRETKTGVVKDKLAHGMTVRIITVNPNCPLLEQRDIDEQKLAGSTSESIRQLCKWIVELKQIQNARIEVKFCNTLPTELYFRVDDYVYVGPYQYGRESQRTITLEYRNHGKAYKYYSDYFDKLWNDQNFCKLDSAILNA